MNHFDKIDDYDAEINPLLRDHYLRKKIALIRECLAAIPSKEPHRVLDVGCGTGWHIKSLAEAGTIVTGIDSSPRQVERAKINNPNSTVLYGDAMQLPFPDSSFDLSFAINMIHHLPSRDAQRNVLKEMQRVVRPGGMVVIHDVNVFNPIIRFYMDYVFSRIHKIDDGGEIWIDPDWLAETLGAPYLTRYFTFVPEITPNFLFPIFRAFEGILERTPLTKWGAHFSAVFQRR